MTVTAAHPIDVIGIGISTGGPDALGKVIPLLPASLAIPIVIVQHMPPVFTRSLAEALDRRSALTVTEAIDGERLLPGHAYMAPGGLHLAVERGSGVARLAITDEDLGLVCRPSVDYLCESLARGVGRRCLGVIMTGMGSDGTAGCRLLHEQGASIFAQDEATSVVFGMPRGPIEAGLTQRVLPLGEMAGAITHFVGSQKAA